MERRSQAGRQIIHIEILRILAMLFVVFNHTTDVGFFLFRSCATGSVGFWMHLFNAIFIKAGAPLFFMISGALLIPRQEESIGQVFRKRILKYGFILLAASLVYAYLNHAFGIVDYTPQTLWRGIYSSGIMYHLWFLYGYIAFLMLLPVLRRFAPALKDEHYRYLIALHAVFRLISVVEYLTNGLSYSIKVELVPLLPWNAIVYPLIGYYVEHRLDVKRMKKRTLAGLWAIDILMILLCAYATYVKGLAEGEFTEARSQMFFNTFVFFNAFVIYVTVKRIFGDVKYSERIRRIICNIGSCCFGIYLLHPAVKLCVERWQGFFAWLDQSGLPRILRGWIFTGCLWLGSLAVTEAYKWIAGRIRGALGTARKKA